MGILITNNVMKKGTELNKEMQPVRFVLPAAEYARFKDALRASGYGYTSEFLREAIREFLKNQEKKQKCNNLI